MTYWRVNEQMDGGRGTPIPSTWQSLAVAAIIGLDIGLAWLVLLQLHPGLAGLLAPALIKLYPWKTRP